jgi:hypothetical protein
MRNRQRWSVPLNNRQACKLLDLFARVNTASAFAVTGRANEAELKYLEIHDLPPPSRTTL